MRRIYIKGLDSLNRSSEVVEDKFESYLIDLCEEHQKQGRAFAFALLLYDFNDPQIDKVLKDEEYWNSLNKISGDSMTIFSVHKYPTYDSYEHQNAIFTVNEDDGMYDIYQNENLDDPSIVTTKFIKEYFGDFIIKYPAILFFQVHNARIIDTACIELDEIKIEDSFLELKEYITAAVNSIKKMDTKYKKHPERVFDLLKPDVKQIKLKKQVKKYSNTAANVFGWVLKLKGFIFPNF